MSKEFTYVGTHTWEVPNGVGAVEYLVVGGGGMVLTGTIEVTPGATYTIIVGDGGVGGGQANVTNGRSDEPQAQNGSDSQFHTVVRALGGQGGNGSRTSSQGEGGSAQSGSETSPTGGFGGGNANYSGGGGGGAGGDGSKWYIQG